MRSKKAQALLAYLALPVGRAHSRDKLAGLLWGETSDVQARQSLRQALSDARGALASRNFRGLVTDHDSVSLDRRSIDTDVQEFERSSDRRDRKALERAATLYQGELLEGLHIKESAFDAWLRAERERLHESALAMLRRLLRLETKSGDTDAIATAMRIVTLDPLEENAHRDLMALYLGAGRRGAALRQYQICVDILRRELGVEPDTATKQLYREIVRQRAHGSTESPRYGPRGRRQPHRVTALRTPEGPIIGRESQLAMLGSLLAHSCDGRGVVALISGEAGVGKTRLAEELMIEAQRRRARVLIGRATEMTGTLAFGAWVDALRAIDVARDHRLIEQVGASWRAELARLIPEFEESAAHTVIEPGGHLRLFEAIARFLALLGSRRPLLLVLEDLHWADEMTLRLLPFLMPWIERHRICVVATYREEALPDAALLSQALTDLARHRHVSSLTLARLEKADTVELVHALAERRADGRASATLAQSVWEFSEGNPLMVVEAVRALLDRTGLATHSSVPFSERVERLITERVSRLSSAARALAAAAAVLGRDFEFRVLHHVAALPEREAAQALEELVRRRLLEASGDRFDFTHDQIRAVIDRQLLAPRRKMFHAGAAQALEAAHADDLAPWYSALAVHYRAAEIWPKAVTYLRHAGAQALARSAYSDAVRWYEDARAAVDRLPKNRATVEKSIDVRLDLRNALFPSVAVENLRRTLTEAEELARTLDDPRRLGWILAYLSLHLGLTGDAGQAISVGRQAQASARASADIDLMVATDYVMGQGSLVVGDYQQAIAFQSAVVRRLVGDMSGRRCGLHGFPAVMARSYLAWALAELGDFPEALTVVADGLRLARSLDHPYSVAMMSLGASHVHLLRADFQAAIEVAQAGLALSRTWEVRLLSVYLRWVLGVARVGAADHDGVVDIECSVQDLESIGMGLFLTHALRDLAEAYFAVGKRDMARNYAERVFRLTTEHGEIGVMARTKRLMGDILSTAPSEMPEAEGAYRDGIALAEAMGMRPLATECRRRLAASQRRHSG